LKDSRAVRIKKLATGVPGLDTVLGGGLPEYSFNLIAGAPGTGKTTMAHQIMFANATPDRPAIYFTVLGEPPIKMLRYQQQMRFFDADKLDNAIKFMDLGQEVMEQDLDKVFETIVREVESTGPRIVVVDSFRGVVRVGKGGTNDAMALPAFVQRLALFLTGWQATTFLVGDYADAEIRENPVFTVADGIIWLYQSVERNSMVRKLQVMKMRGQPTMPGLHTFRITEDGLRIFPRLVSRPEVERRLDARSRIPSGIDGLDGMLGGGILAGDSVLVAGPSGSGKTVLGIQFITEAARQGEKGVIAVFEEHPAEYLARAKDLGFDLEGLSAQGKVKVLYLHPQELSVDESLYEIAEAVRELGAKRVVMDSLSGFEVALAPTFRDDFRESLHRMVVALTGIGVTVLMIVEIVETLNELRFSPHMVSFLADDIILQRYAEIGGRLQKVVAVIKMRSSDHSKDLRAYEITRQGMVIGETLKDHRGIILGVPEFRESRGIP